RLDLSKTRVSLAGVINELVGLQNLSQLSLGNAGNNDLALEEFRKAQEEEKKRAGKGIKPATVAAYERLGATYGGWVKNTSGRLIFWPGKEAAEKELPGFLFEREPRASLPSVAGPFALTFEKVPLSSRG